MGQPVELCHERRTSSILTGYEVSDRRSSSSSIFSSSYSSSLPFPSPSSRGAHLAGGVLVGQASPGEGGQVQRVGVEGEVEARGTTHDVQALPGSPHGLPDTPHDKLAADFACGKKI